jgi:hypothetical protein
MTTGVPEGANDAVASAYSDERRKRRITRHIGANLRQGGGGTERRRRMSALGSLLANSEIAILANSQASASGAADVVT